MSLQGELRMTEKEICDKAYKRIFELYGNVPDLRIISRLRCGYIQHFEGDGIDTLATIATYPSIIKFLTNS